MVLIELAALTGTQLLQTTAKNPQRASNSPHSTKWMQSLSSTGAGSVKSVLTRGSYPKETDTMCIV